VRLALGTAQLGMHYGVASSPGRPSADEIGRILRTALDLGVEYIDTAAAYGEAEVAIRRFLRAADHSGRVRVGTKTPRLPAGLSASALVHEVAAAIDRSRTRLGVETLDDLLIHSADDLREYGSRLIDVLMEHRDASRVRRIGLSIYDEADAMLALAHPSLAAAQFPFNVFQRGLTDGGAVERLRLAGHETFARSVLLQGLLSLSPDPGEAAVPGSGPWLASFGQTCASHDVAPVAAALGYAASRSGAHFLVVGVESAAQLREVSGFMQKPLPPALVREMDARFVDVPAAVRDPRLWGGVA
jgi:aryl-alcohol dehydrogenase-like predicted oxidoreductase